MSLRFKAHLALFAGNFLYGVNYVIAKKTMGYISPEAVIFLRILPSTMLFWAIAFITRNSMVNGRPEYKNLFIAGLLGVFLNQFLFIKGLSLSSPIDSAIIITSNPVFVLVMAALILKEKVTKLKVSGIIIGASGALLLAGSKGLVAYNPEHLTGDILLLVNSASFAIYMMYAKPLMQKYDSVFVLKWTFLFGSLLYLPFGIKPMLAVQWSQLPMSIYAALFYIVICTTVLTYFLINYGIRHLSPTTVSIYIYIQPVVSVVMAFLTGTDTLNWINISAGLLVCFGVYLVSINRGGEKR
ncbi:MAG TPA: EamA family transporter [Bacteroidales bacterium]|nr:EamA family transporter [Bacteroidales bacterium]